MGNAQLTETQVRVIRRALDNNTSTVREQAEMYRLSAETVRRIGRRETWGWLPDEDIRDLKLQPDPVQDAKAAASLAKVLQAQPVQRPAESSRVPLDPLAGGDAPAEVEHSALEKLKQELVDRNPNGLIAELTRGKKPDGSSST